MNKVMTTIAACLVGVGASADTITADTITVADAYVRVAGPVAKAAAAFMTLTNNGTTDDRLVAASVDIARKAELHTHIHKDGVMMMREVEGGFAVPAGGSHALERGGDHVMLMGLTQRLNDGDQVTVTLDFEIAPDVTLILDVRTDQGHRGHGAASHGATHN